MSATFRKLPGLRGALEFRTRLGLRPALGPFETLRQAQGEPPFDKLRASPQRTAALQNPARPTGRSAAPRNPEAAATGARPAPVAPLPRQREPPEESSRPDLP